MDPAHKALEDIAYMRDVMEQSRALEHPPALHKSPTPLRGMSLSELEADLQAAHEALSDALEQGLEIPPDALATIEAYSLAVGKKRDAMAYVIHSLDLEVQHVDEEIERLKRLRDVRSNAKDRLVNLIVRVMAQSGLRKVKGETSQFSLVQNPSHIEVDAEDLVPPEFKRIPEPEPPRVDKKAVRAAIESGQDVPGARLVPGGLRLKVT